MYFVRRPFVAAVFLFTAGIAMKYGGIICVSNATVWFFAVVIFITFVCMQWHSFRCNSEGGGKNSESQGQSKVTLRLATAMMCVILLGYVWCSLWLNKSDPLMPMEGKEVHIYGWVKKIESKSEDYHKLVVEVTKDRGLGETRDHLVCVSGVPDWLPYIVGKNITVSGTVSLPEQQRNPGTFNYRAYLMTKGIRTVLNCNINNITVDNTKKSTDVIQGGKCGLYSISYRLKYHTLSYLKEHMAEGKIGVLAGLLFGDKTLLDEDTYEAFQQNGIAHILSVSGIHVTILYAAVAMVMGGRRNGVTCVVSFFVLVVYAALASFTPSVMRASLMIGSHILATLLKKPYDLLSGVSAAGLVLLLQNPLALFHAGFQLSFLAVYTLAFCLPFLLRILEPIKNSEFGGMVTTLCPLLVIQFGMAPITAYYFNYFSVAAFFLNIPIIFIAGILIPLGVLLIPLSYIGGHVAHVCIDAAEIMIAIMVKVSGIVADSGNNAVLMESPEPGILVFFYGLLFFLCSEGARILFSRKRVREVCIMISFVVIAAVCMFSIPWLRGDDSNLVFVDVGQGDCLHIRTDDGKNILVDGGGSESYNIGKKILLPYLLKNGVKELDMVFVTHLHADHYLGICQLAQEMKIKKLVVYEGNLPILSHISQQTGINEKDIVFISAGSRVMLGENAYADIVHPQKKTNEEYMRFHKTEGDENEFSLVLNLSINGVKILMTGDVGVDGERQMLQNSAQNKHIMKTDILKVGHHGSKNSSADSFLNEISPKIAVIQVGKRNIYGHPHASVLDKLEKRGIMIYRNDLHGAVCIDVYDNDLHIETMADRLVKRAN